jgi:transposase-like protein
MLARSTRSSRGRYGAHGVALTLEHRVNAVREVEAGGKVGEVARRVGVSLQTLARWRARHGGMTVPEAREKPQIGRRP